MKVKFPCLILSGLLLIITSCSDRKSDPVGNVNPYIGNISHLLVPTYPTVHLPNSMVRFYPNRDNFTTNYMQGFPLNVVSHRSGKVFTLFPFGGSASDAPQNLLYTYDNEFITPYCYSVKLDEYNIDVKYAPAGKAGFFSLRFNNDLNRTVMLRTNGQGELKYENNAISGFDTFDNVRACLYMEFEIKPEAIKVRDMDSTSGSMSVTGNRISMIASFKPD
ncbi:MAG: hypothetical protein Q8868_10740, partial [Bacteroidota bacterium]|nr:hypothetical protein [Bacteroidota bacterium]